MIGDFLGKFEIIAIMVGCYATEVETVKEYQSITKLERGKNRFYSGTPTIRESDLSVEPHFRIQQEQMGIYSQ